MPNSAAAVMPPRQVKLAAWLTMASGLAFVVVAIAVLATRVALFSAGVAAMLVLYGVLVAGVGWALLRLRGFSFGACVTCTLIHLLVLGNLARVSHAGLFVPLMLVPLAVVVSLFSRPARHALGRE